MFVRSHMTREPACLGPAATVREVVQTMARHKIGHIPIVNEKKHVLGILSDHELRVAADRPVFWELRAHEIMAPAPLTIESNAPFGRALTDLCTAGADALLVLERGVLVGILTDQARACGQATAGGPGSDSAKETCGQNQ